LVAEPDETARNRGRVRALEVEHGASHTITWLTTAAALGPTDLAIVATTAERRVEIVEELLAIGCRRFLLEKIVCQSEQQYSALVANLRRHDAKAWVHCPRRYYPLYQALQSVAADDPFLSLKVTGGDLGLGCNAIHFVDLFAYLTGRPGPALNGSLLDDAVVPSRRRSGVVEFSGTITGTADPGHWLDITFIRNSSINVTLSLVTSRFSAFIDETAGYFAGSSELLDSIPERAREVRLIPSSELTTVIVDEILESDASLLPSVEDSWPVHRALFEIFLDCMTRVTGVRAELCRIT